MVLLTKEEKEEIVMLENIGDWDSIVEASRIQNKQSRKVNFDEVFPKLEKEMRDILSKYNYIKE